MDRNALISLVTAVVQQAMATQQAPVNPVAPVAPPVPPTGWNPSPLFPSPVAPVAMVPVAPVASQPLVAWTPPVAPVAPQPLVLAVPPTLTANIPAVPVVAPVVAENPRPKKEQSKTPRCACCGQKRWRAHVSTVTGEPIPSGLMTMFVKAHPALQCENGTFSGTECMTACKKANNDGTEVSGPSFAKGERAGKLTGKLLTPLAVIASDEQQRALYETAVLAEAARIQAAR